MPENTQKCCSPAGKDHRADTGDAGYLDRARSVRVATPKKQAELKGKLSIISGGFFDMGARQSRFPADMDSPRRKIRISPFRISPFAVSNQEFADFVADTGYVTVAEQEGWSYVFHLFADTSGGHDGYPAQTPWWRAVSGACWHAPEGPNSSWTEHADHPVVQIAWFDAIAYCVWSGLRLPWEGEWEFAARGGLAKKKFPWGNVMMPAGEHAMNTWQGRFPAENTGEDGWVKTAPVDSYQPNGFGLYNMTGNVWEWVQDYFGERASSGRLADHDPRGPNDGYARVQRGGSYLCHDSYCDRYHVHSRTRNDPDSSTGNCGFRVAADF